MCIGVCVQMSFCPHGVSVDLHTYVNVVGASVYKCVCVLGECAADPVPALCSFLPKAMLFFFQTPLVPPKGEKERKEKKPRRKKKNLTVPVGSQRQAFPHQGQNKKSPKSGIFSGTERRGLTLVASSASSAVYI